MENEAENLDSINEDTTAEAETTEGQELDVDALKARAAEADELKTANRQLFERAKKAEGFVKVDGKWVKAPKPEEGAAAVQALKAKTGELDETQLDYLDLKGITDNEDIDVIQSIVKKTGMTVRQALKDDYVLKKLEANKAQREVKGATPSSTKRGGNNSGELASALAKFEATGELPDDFALRSAVVNAKVDSSNGNKPAWH